jgi:hypothetical protein
VNDVVNLFQLNISLEKKNYPKTYLTPSLWQKRRCRMPPDPKNPTEWLTDQNKDLLCQLRELGYLHERLTRLTAALILSQGGEVTVSVETYERVEKDEKIIFRSNINTITASLSKTSQRKFEF